MDRFELNQIFKDILGNSNVYFQPPETVKLNYPCILYELDRVVATKANNKKYKLIKRYTVTLIDPNPDTTYMDAILELPYSSFDRMFSTSNLNHFVFTIYRRYN